MDPTEPEPDVPKDGFMITGTDDGQEKESESTEIASSQVTTDANTDANTADGK